MQFSSYDAALLCMRLLDWLASFGLVTSARSSDGCIHGCLLHGAKKKRGWGQRQGRTREEEQLAIHGLLMLCDQPSWSLEPNQTVLCGGQIRGIQVSAG